MATNITHVDCFPGSVLAHYASGMVRTYYYGKLPKTVHFFIKNSMPFKYDGYTRWC